MSSTPGVGDAGAQIMSNLVARQGVQQAFMSFFAYGTFERFPELTIGVLESGAGWIGSFLDRMDALFGDTMFRHLHQLAERPSDYFRRQCFISCDPDETAAPLIIDHVGARPLHVGDRLPASGPSGGVAGEPRAFRGAARRGGHRARRGT